MNSNRKQANRVASLVFAMGVLIMVAVSAVQAVAQDFWDVYTFSGNGDAILLTVALCESETNNRGENTKVVDAIAK